MSDFFEFVRVRSDCDGQGDFNGDQSILSLSEQEEFLQKYAKVCRSSYKANTSEKVVTESEVKNALKDVELYDENPFRNRLCVKTAQAYAVSKKKYKNLTLYTKKASVEDGTICFNDKDCSPIPCAKIVAEDVSFFKAEVCVGAEYFTSIRGEYPSDVMTGRIIEFRKGVTELIKLQIYPDGRIYARLNKKDLYHHINECIATVEFGRPFVLEVSVSDGFFTVSIDGVRSKRLEMRETLLPDTVFFSGGMLPIGKWSVKPLQIIAKRQTDVFEPSNEESRAESLGEVKLPYVIGTEKHADDYLVLIKTFDYLPDGNKVVLHVDALDPDGEVYLNGVKVIDTENFLSVEADVTEYIKVGENDLKIVVSPRAPEILYSWHKHRDPYNGWFARGVYIETRRSAYIENVFVKTESVSGGIVANVRAEVISDVQAEAVFSVKIGHEKTIRQNVRLSKGKNVCECSFNDNELLPWSVDAPVLYDVAFELSEEDETIDATSCRTGFRTIEQKDGKVFLNGEEIVLKGALLMQFLPPYDEIPLNHVCPSDEQIAWQALMAKKMNCNIVRMHQLGYGSSDSRFAKIFDELGIMTIWVTRCIDSVATLKWKDVWEQKTYYQDNMKKVINSPSVVMWEGGNEFYLYFDDIDKIYKEFVGGVKEVDDSRLICPVSHLYYGADIFNRNCNYYQDDGLRDEFFNKRVAPKEWHDDLVVRSVHTYNYLLGYGSPWSELRLQSWTAQKAMLESVSHAYLVTEYAVIGRQNTGTPEMKTFCNVHSYEHGDEYALGYLFEDKIDLSQSYQALSAKYASKKMLAAGVDGLMWCCLTGGANDAGYLKPPIDFYGYPKLGFYSLKECFETSLCFDDTTDVVWGGTHSIRPVVVCKPDGKRHTIDITVENEFGEPQEHFIFVNVWFDRHIIRLDGRSLSLPDGYYKITYTVN